LDVLETSHDPVPQAGKALARDLSPGSLLSVVCPGRRHGEQQQRSYRPHGSKHLSLAQATNIIEAVNYARAIGLPLVAHLTIHWVYTNVGDDPDGKLFAKFREGLNKWLRRQGIDFAAAWSRERMSGGQAEVEHCHMLFHLPAGYCARRKLQVEAAIYRLIKRHGRGYWAEEVIKLAIWPNPDGKYLIKGGGPKVWKQFQLRKEHRRLPRHYSRQAVRHHAEHRTSRTPSGAHCR
jgi:hypothetical protein